MKNLSSRIFSAAVALLVLFLALYFGRESGVYLITFFVVVRGSFEIARMFFNENYPKNVKRFFVGLSSIIFLIVTQEHLRVLSGVAMIFSFVLIVCFGVLLHKQFKSVDLILTFVAKNCLGLIYACFLPATVVWTLQTNNGMEWFLCLLAVVFAGDIGAFLFGVKFGKTKIAPLLSPNKSLQGSFGGLLFSTLAGFSFIFILPNTPLPVLLLCGILGGFFGQIGDFFESLMKRVSGVKDSGSIMPGHGGVLDRIDGVLLSAPWFYIVATYYSL